MDSGNQSNPSIMNKKTLKIELGAKSKVTVLVQKLFFNWRPICPWLFAITLFASTLFYSTFARSS